MKTKGKKTRERDAFKTVPFLPDGLPDPQRIIDRHDQELNDALEALGSVNLEAMLAEQTALLEKAIADLEGLDLEAILHDFGPAKEAAPQAGKEEKLSPGFEE